MSVARAQPGFFGPETRALFGALHRAAGDSPVSIGLLLCNPFGYEAICAHRTLRHIAEGAAEAHIPALRFDYDGTGNSAGTDMDPDRLRAWLDSVHAAADAIRNETGCTRLVFLGIRLGATLATLAAAERDDVEGIIAIAPIINAKAYLRELRALQMATGVAVKTPRDPASEHTEATGFLISPSTREALNAVDLGKLGKRPAAHVLILDRHDLPGSDRWAAHLTTLGAAVTRESVPDYVEMMLSPHSSVVPATTLRLALTWLGKRADETPRLPAPPAQRHASKTFRSTAVIPPALRTHAATVESLEFIGEDRTLFGVLSKPVDHPGSEAVKSVLLINAGATHHIGPNRMYVLLARTLATMGCVVLRMDISGIGESLPRPGEAENIVYSAYAVTDVSEAMRYLREKLGAAECAVVGLCSGAYHALKTAVGGGALATAVMINPLTFFWKEGMALDAKKSDQRIISEAQRYQQTMFQLSSWRKLLSGKVDLRNVAQIMWSRTASSFRHAARDIARRLRLPLRDDLGTELEQVARRGVGMRFVFAEDDPGIELLRLQGGSTYHKLLRERQLDVAIIAGADHTFTPHEAREKLLEHVSAALAQPQPAQPKKKAAGAR